MNKKMLGLYGLKWNPFAPDVPVEALHVSRRIESDRERRRLRGRIVEGLSQVAWNHVFTHPAIIAFADPLPIARRVGRLAAL